MVSRHTFGESMVSRHTFGESVKVNLKDGGIIYNGKIVNIKFTESKVFYDLDVLVWSAETSDKDLHTRIYNIDSAFVESTEGAKDLHISDERKKDMEQYLKGDIQ